MLRCDNTKHDFLSTYFKNYEGFYTRDYKNTIIKGNNIFDKVRYLFYKVR
jgi:hypothetical protein